MHVWASITNWACIYNLVITIIGQLYMLFASSATTLSSSLRQRASTWRLCGSLRQRVCESWGQTWGEVSHREAAKRLPMCSSKVAWPDGWWI